MKQKLPNQNISKERLTFTENIIKKLTENKLTNKTAVENDQIIRIEESAMGRPIQWLYMGDISNIKDLEKGYLEVCQYFFYYLKAQKPIRTLFKLVDTTVLYALIYPMGKLKEENEKQDKS